MGTCNIDHSPEDVVKKLDNQKVFLPEDVTEKTNLFLSNKHSQETLNELFHLLKKYDLASETEQKERDQKIRNITSKER